MLKKLIKNNMLLLIMFIMLVYFGPAIYRPAQASEKAIVTAIGVDKDDDGYEISMLVVVPTAQKTDSANGVELVSAKGRSLGDAVNNISLDIGKTVGLAHCDAIVLSSDAMSTDVRATLDYLNRSGELTKNAMLFNTNEKAKDVLNTTISTKIVPALKLSTMVEYNKEFSISQDASLDGFYTEYYTPSSISLLPIITTQPSNSNSGGDSSQSQGGQDKKVLKCNGDICVVKKGVMVATLTGDFVTSFNALKPSIKKGYLQVENVSDGIYDNANILMEIRNKKISRIPSFVDGVPHVTYKGTLRLKIVEVNAQNNNLDTLNEVQLRMSDTIKTKLIDDIKSSMAGNMAVAIDSNADIFEYDNMFYSKMPTQWENYKKQHKNPSDFLPNIQINYDIKIIEKL